MINSYDEYIGFISPGRSGKRISVFLSAIMFLLITQGCNGEGEIICDDCRIVDSEDLPLISVADAPFRTSPALAGITVSTIPGGIEWIADENLHHDHVELIVEIEGKLYIADTYDEDSSYSKRSEERIVGVRPVRKGRAGFVFTPEKAEYIQDNNGVEKKNSELHSDYFSSKGKKKSFDKVNSGLSDSIKDGPDIDSLLLSRFKKHGSCMHTSHDDSGRESGSPRHKTQNWRPESIDILLEPVSEGLFGRADLDLFLMGTATNLRMPFMADSLDNISISSPADITLDSEGILIEFESSPESGSVVEIGFDYFLGDFEDAGISPSDGVLSLDSFPGLFFFTGRHHFIPAPSGSSAIDMPLRLELRMPSGWFAASNLKPVQGEENILSWSGWDLPQRGRTALAAGAYRRSAMERHGIKFQALALPDEDENVADLDDYSSFFADVIGVFLEWGSITQTDITVASVSSAHGGSAMYSMVMAPDYIMQRPRSRGRDFFMAHELSHQWWGSVVWPAENLDLWLTEGLADYSALRAIEIIRGEDDAEIVWNENLDLLMHLMVEGYGGNPGRDVPVRPETASDLQDYIYYLKGSWVLRHLEKIIGRENFDEALSRYFSGAVHSPAGTEDFMMAVHSVIEEEIDWFWPQWLEGRGLPEFDYAFYLNPSDPADFELIITQKGDQPFPGKSWILPIYSSFDAGGWACPGEQITIIHSSELHRGDSAPYKACSPR